MKKQEYFIRIKEKNSELLSNISFRLWQMLNNLTSDREAENIIDRGHEQRGSLNKKYICLKNQKESRNFQDTK